jgi:hypothetical protein
VSAVGGRLAGEVETPVKQQLYLLLVASALLSACSESPGVPGADAGAGWQHQTFGSGCAAAIWGASASEVFVAGSQWGVGDYQEPLPHVWRFDGADWHEQLVSGTAYELVDVWGAGADDVFAAGYGYGPELQGWPSIWRYDGADWTEAELPVETGFAGAIWGASANHVIAAVGTTDWSTVFLRFDGASWAPMAAQLPDGLESAFYGLWGSSAADVYAVGVRLDVDHLVGSMAHFDGESWSLVDTPGGGVPNSVWGLDASTVFAVGEGGMILERDGDGWSAMDSGSEQRLLAVWGRAADEVYAVGVGGGGQCTALRFDGAAWSPFEVDCSALADHPVHYLSDVWGTAEGDLFLVGGVPGSGVPSCAGSFVIF